MLYARKRGDRAQSKSKGNGGSSVRVLAPHAPIDAGCQLSPTCKECPHVKICENCKKSECTGCEIYNACPLN